MKRSERVLCVLPFLVCAFLFSGTAHGQSSERPTNVQALIDSAKPGSTVQLPPGLYEGPVVISKPLQLRGNEAQLVRASDAPTDQPLLQVKASGVVVSGLILQDDQTPLVLEGDANEVTNTSITSRQTAIKLINADHNLLQNLQIRGTEPELNDRGHGIELRQANDNRIENSQFQFVQDGIYLEHSARNQISHNHITDSRYGVHLMFTERSRISDNLLERNVTGAMVMEDVGSHILNNRIFKQSGHVHSQGVLLYNVTHASIANNLIADNRIGLYVDSSTANSILDNDISNNFLGVLMTGATDNELRGNVWSGNVVQAQAVDSSNNRLWANFWDTHRGLDLNGDNLSELPYLASPFFLALTDAVPAYQLFFQAPGFAVLEEMFTSKTDHWLQDTAPLLAAPDHPANEAQAEPLPKRVLFVSLLMLAAGILPFWKNRIWRSSI
ncbi:right-handed parallel beta-helix repeat-containing protein [Tumebacillus algifaecis]|nr:NosD domain-containing protein [Tumebacillus algifaecis]